MSDIKLIDSHCHLIFENFEKDLEDIKLGFDPFFFFKKLSK